MPAESGPQNRLEDASCLPGEHSLDMSFFIVGMRQASSVLNNDVGREYSLFIVNSEANVGIRLSHGFPSARETVRDKMIRVHLDSTTFISSVLCLSSGTNRFVPRSSYPRK